eukprot:Opistho-2@57656
MTANTQNLLVELFVEELPPKALSKLGEAFASMLHRSLVEQDLIAPDDDGVPGSELPFLSFASPRRLAVQIADVRAQAPEKAQRHKLMPVAVALDAAGQATPALLKKLAALGEDASAVPRLQRAPDGKAEALFLDRVAPGVSLADG